MSKTTIIGFGSLLSEKSARSTFGTLLSNFRLARVHNYRRVFTHPASIFFTRGIANLSTKEIASLSTEPADGYSFTVSVFDIPDTLLPAFYEREEEFYIPKVEYTELDGITTGYGLMCTRWTDEEYIQAKGQEIFDTLYGQYNIPTIWGWNETSGILPCRIYLRHCLLAVEKLGADVYTDFITTTYLSDRQTTIQEYIAKNPSIMEEVPPPHLAERYNG